MRDDVGYLKDILEAKPQVEKYAGHDRVAF